VRRQGVAAGAGAPPGANVSPECAAVASSEVGIVSIDPADYFGRKYHSTLQPRDICQTDNEAFAV
jgi:hypothetical protein